MINAQTAAALEDAAGRSSKRKQDKTNPMVINIEDGRLMPNTPRLRAHPKYRVYGGRVDDDLPTRMRWLKGAARVPRAVVNSAPDEPFDLGTASTDDMIVFAMDNYGVALNPSWPAKKLRTEVAKLAESAEKQLDNELG